MVPVEVMMMMIKKAKGKPGWWNTRVGTGRVRDWLVGDGCGDNTYKVHGWLALT